MPRKRIESKRRRKDYVLVHSDGWLLFWLGWTYNTHPPNRLEPFFETIEDMRQYYLENRSRTFEEMGSTNEFWAWHKFEDHDRAACEYCQRFGIELQDGRENNNA